MIILIDSKEIKKEELNILIEFDKFAKENNIKYFLGYGTLLGAVRHKGFIPWDDDIDIIIMREDYDKLLDIVRKRRTIGENNQYYFKLPLDDNYAYTMPKLIDSNTIVYEKNISSKYFLGLWIDIFVLDNWFESDDEAKKYFTKYRIYQRLNELFIVGKCVELKWKILKVLSLPLKLILSILGLNSKHWIKKMMSFEKNSNSKYVGNIIFNSYRLKEKVFKEDFNDSILVEFEGHYFPAPIGYERYLSMLYGDYMKLPPENERINHEFECYRLI